MILSDLKHKGIVLYPMKGNSYRGFIKIDHIATGKRIVIDNAVYKDVFANDNVIGVPDHSLLPILDVLKHKQ